MTYYDCPNCTNECCNSAVHELRNAEISLAYVADQFDRGYTGRELIDRMLGDIKRLSEALKGCG